MSVELLEDCFVGKREVSGFLFTKVAAFEHCYIFTVCPPGADYNHYEVIHRKITPKCLDFDKRIYSDTEFKESYPSQNYFGKIAFTYHKFEDALAKAQEINSSFLEF